MTEEMLKEIVASVAQLVGLVGIGGVIGFTIRQDRRITKVETLCEGLIAAVTKLAEKLDSVVIVPKDHA